MNNMKLVKKIFVFALILFIFTCTKVNAICSTEEKNNLIQLAYNVKFNYELNNEEKSNNKRVFNITISGLTKDIYVIYDPYVYRYIENSVTPGIEKMEDSFKDNKSYKVKIYGNTKNCKETFLTTRTIDIPKYNIYSERKECKGIEEFKLCNMWYEGEIKSDSFFKTEIEKYKNSLNKQEKETKTNNNENFFTKFKNIYLSNLYISIAITSLIVILIVVIIIIIIKRKTKKIKIDL